MKSRTKNSPILSRQVHLDFHTGPNIPNIGRDFNDDEFGDTLLKAGVESITLFAKCHHGYSYHDTKVGKTHPNLETNLLERQINACKARGIATPIYLSCCWDELVCHTHPEWRVVDENGRWFTTNGGGHLQSPSWGILDFGTEYIDYLCAQIEEVATMFPQGDGIFLDICHQYPSYSSQALDKMKIKGLDWQNPEHILSHALDIKQEFLTRTTASSKIANSDLPVVHNHGHITRGDRRILNFNSHLEIESLPTGGWGYEHFPISARYAEVIGTKFLGMTGKFHTFWGEFGAYKAGEALAHECALMLAYGASCSIGDHLHPSGKIDHDTYKEIAKAFKLVEEQEQFKTDSNGLAEIGILSVEAINDAYNIDTSPKHAPSDEGVVRMLLEMQLQFDVLDRDVSFDKYKLLILPDEIIVDVPLKAKLDAYIKAGGQVLLSGTSGIVNDVMIFDIGAEYKGVSDFKFDYAQFSSHKFGEMPTNPIYLYDASQRIVTTDGVSLGDIYDPYFNREIQHFSGHQNTPNQTEPSGYDLGVQKGAITYLAHPIFKTYMQKGSTLILDAMHGLIKSILEKPMVEVIGAKKPGLRLVLREQSNENRYILHILYSAPRLRGSNNSANIEVIQENIDIHDLVLNVQLPHSIKTAKFNGTDILNIENIAQGQHFNIDKFSGQCVVTLEY